MSRGGASANSSSPRASKAQSSAPEKNLSSHQQNQAAESDQPDSEPNKSTRGGSKKKRKRLNLDLTESDFELLQKLADESGSTMTDILRKGLAVYGVAQEERHKGRQLAISKDDRVIKEILIM